MKGGGRDMCFAFENLFWNNLFLRQASTGEAILDGHIQDTETVRQREIFYHAAECERCACVQAYFECGWSMSSLLSAEQSLSTGAVDWTEKILSLEEAENDARASLYDLALFPEELLREVLAELQEWLKDFNPLEADVREYVFTRIRMQEVQITSILGVPSQKKIFEILPRIIGHLISQATQTNSFWEALEREKQEIARNKEVPQPLPPP